VIEAAGGVPWRESTSGVEALLVHRPRYDDWSLPKGTLKPAEHPLVAAVREVREESGLETVPGRPLGELRYVKEGAPKRSRYWALEVTGGVFVPNREVDEVRWLSLDAAASRLPADRDRSVVVRFATELRATRALVMVRHASAGDSQQWQGDDAERPLDELGRRQAAAMADVLATYRVDTLVSADVLRCVQTVEPYAAARGVAVELEPLMSYDGSRAAGNASRDRLLELALRENVTAVCSQGGTIDDLLFWLGSRLGQRLERPTRMKKGAFAVLHLTRGPVTEVVATEVFDPPVRRRD
jgi:8-oxo-dGTP diphosphatase